MERRREDSRIVKLRVKYIFYAGFGGIALNSIEINQLILRTKISETYRFSCLSEC